jgi:site-specific recombinase XerD
MRAGTVMRRREAPILTPRFRLLASVRRAVIASGIITPARPQGFCHCFGMQLQEGGQILRRRQELLQDSDVNAAMSNATLFNRCPIGACSPADLL